MTAVSNIERFIAHLRVPLYRNGYALVVNSGISAVLGVAFWAVAAHNYSPEIVGLNSAAISTMVSLSFFAQLDMTNGLNRFLPTAGRMTGRMITVVYAMCVVLAFLASTIFVWSMGSWSPDLAQLKDVPWFGASFVAATMIWTIFALQDGVLVGLRQALWIPIENGFFSLAKLVLLIPLAAVLIQHGIFMAWTAPVIVLVILINIFLFRRLIPAHVAATRDIAVPLVRSQIARYVTGDYFSSLIGMAVNLLLPLMIIAQLGAAANAYYGLAWTVTYALYLISLNMGMSLIAEAVTEPTKLHHYVRQTLLQSARVVVPLILATEIAAPYFLQFFGESYMTEGALLLRLLCLSALPYIINAIYISLARVNRNVGMVVLLQAGIYLQVLIWSYFLLRHDGLVGIGYAWLISQGTVAILLAGGAFRKAGCPSLKAILQAKDENSSA